MYLQTTTNHLFHQHPEGTKVVRGFLPTQRQPYWIYLFLIERGLVILASLATPMVIESKCMSLSQVQKELMISRCRGGHIGLLFGDIDNEPGPPSSSGYADSHRVKMYASITNTEGVMVILMIP